MTIKQQGGIFGRNPTFNDLTVDGTVNVPNDSLSGDSIDGGSASVDSLNVDGAVTADAGSVFDAGTNFVADSSAANKSLVLGSSGAAAGTNQLGASVAFSRINTTSPRAAIAAINTDGNYERMGLAFYTHRSNNSADPMIRSMMIRHDGHVFIDDTNLVFSTAGTGIDFSATAGSGTSELFDDYEEGTWTPALTFLFGSAGITYANRYGFYTKVGNKVYVTATIQLSSKGTGNGNAYVNGLPFVSGDFSGNSHAFSLTSISNLTYTGQVNGIVYANAGFMYFGQTTEAGVNSNLTEANFANNTTVVLSGSYFV